MCDKVILPKGFPNVMDDKYWSWHVNPSPFNTEKYEADVQDYFTLLMVELMPLIHAKTSMDMLEGLRKENPIKRA